MAKNQTKAYSEAGTKALIAGSVQISYVLECDKCHDRLQHSFAMNEGPLGKDKAFVADMAYNNGWLFGGGRYESDGELNGEFTVFLLCPKCGRSQNK